MKIKISFLVMILVVSSIFLLSSCNPFINNNYFDGQYPTNSSTILVYFTNPPNDAGLADRLVDFMDTAKLTIDVAIYGLNEYHDQVVNELIKKKDEGVKVRVVTDTDSLTKYKDDFDKLKNNGINIVFDNKSKGPYVVYGTYGKGKFVAIGDSSPIDDGTGAPHNTLYDGYNVLDDARLCKNIINWLALK